ncbi:MAG: WG repeat-containing protein, partial [Cyclonatronaceae bacterium]
SQGRAWIRNDSYIGFIDKNEKMIVEPQFAEARSFSEDMAAVRLNSNWFYMGRNNNLITITQPFSNADSFTDGIARVTIGSGQNARYGYIDKKGEFIWFPSR